MDAHDDTPLGPEAEIALAWATRQSRPAVSALLSLDHRLGGFLRRAGEPLTVQMRLAWWRETLTSPAASWPKGDRLLDALSHWHQPGELVPLVDGWEALLAEDLGDGGIAEFSDGRERAWMQLAREIGAPARGVRAAARDWALADLAANLSSSGERARVIDAADLPAGRPPLPAARALRPLAVLGGLGRRALRRGGAPLLEGRGAALTALRLGTLAR